MNKRREEVKRLIQEHKELEIELKQLQRRHKVAVMRTKNKDCSMSEIFSLLIEIQRIEKDISSLQLRADAFEEKVDRFLGE